MKLYSEGDIITLKDERLVPEMIGKKCKVLKVEKHGAYAWVYDLHVDFESSQPFIVYQFPECFI